MESVLSDSMEEFPSHDGRAESPFPPLAGVDELLLQFSANQLRPILAKLVSPLHPNSIKGEGGTERNRRTPTWLTVGFTQAASAAATQLGITDLLDLMPAIIAIMEVEVRTPLMIIDAFKSYIRALMMLKSNAADDKLHEAILDRADQLERLFQRIRRTC